MQANDLIREKLKKLLPPERYRHSLRVEAAAQKLAGRFGVNKSKASIASLLHDCSRFLSPEQMLKKAVKAIKIALENGLERAMNQFN